MAARRPRSPAASGRGRDAASAKKPARGRPEAKAGSPGSEPERTREKAPSPASRSRKKASPSAPPPEKKAGGAAKRSPSGAKTRGSGAKPKTPTAKRSGAGSGRSAARKARPPAAPRAETLAPREVVAAIPVAVGRVVHAYARAGAAVVALEAELRTGDAVAVRGATTDFCARVTHLQREGRTVPAARAGEAIGVALPTRTRRGDRVFRLDPPDGEAR